MTELQTDNGDGKYALPLNMVELSKQHVEFLQSLHQLGVTIQRPSAKTLQRYRDFWLPLVHANPRMSLIPPADCAWLWHCHRLAPFRYVGYLKHKFGPDCQILEANPTFCFQWTDDEVYGTNLDKTEDEMITAAEQTRSLWNQKFPEEDFHIVESSCQNLPDPEEKKSDDNSLLLNGFDLLGSTDRQSTFLWQVSGPRFVDDEFLKDGVTQYCKFLKLREPAIKENIVLVPTCQIDLIWHTHILSSMIGYFTDCKAIMGSTLNHDDSFTDRSEDGPLDRAFKSTKALWKKSYQEEYFALGGMYRGEPPKEYYSTSWSSRISNEEAQIPLGPFLHLIGIQGASSTNPAGGAYDLEIVWTWKETPAHMSKHPQTSIVGDPAECWIKYDGSANAKLEAAFQEQHGEDTCDLGNGYVVDFVENEQTKKSTGFVRQVQRVVNVKSALTPKVWCWRETQSMMLNHDSSNVFGNPSDCWVKYDDAANQILESAFQAKKTGASPRAGYVVNFAKMKQTKNATGFEREVRRFDAIDEETSNSNTTAFWTAIPGTAPDGSPSFVNMAPKSRTKGENANPFKQGYVFGRSSAGTGYYHITTKEAYEILAERGSRRVDAKKSQIFCLTCCGLCTPSDKALEDLERLETASEVVKARAKLATPNGKVGLDDRTKNNNQISRTYYSDTGMWYFPTSFYYDCGGGCGGAAVTTSGGAACGAAACGGGGCGFGGGGGGCGGGGGGCGGGGGGGG